MTVTELIDRLGVYPKDSLVVVDGYEEGFAEDIKVKRIRVALNKHEIEDGGVYARHGRVDKYGSDDGKAQAMVVFIGEGRHLEDGT